MLPQSCDLSYSRTRITRSDASFYDLVEVIAPDLSKVEFKQNIDSDFELKANDLAQLRMLKAISRGVKCPAALIWQGYSHTKADGTIDLSKQSEKLICHSKNALINRHLRDVVRRRNYIIKGGIFAVKEKNSLEDLTTQKILDELYLENRIKFYQTNPAQSRVDLYKSLDPDLDVCGLGKLGLPSLYGRKGNFPIVFNTSFFLFEPEDFFSDFSLLGDGHGLIIQGGQIKSPPLFNRSAFLISLKGKASVRQISLTDLKLYAFGMNFDLSSFTVNEAADYALYNRYFGVANYGKTLGKTPENPKQVEFIIIDQAIVGYKFGGGIEIPQNGFVLSLPIGNVPQTTFSNQVNYSFLNGSQFRTAIQCGPSLLQNGKIILDKHSLTREEFYRKKYNGEKVIDYGVVPTDYAPDIFSVKAARMAIGVDFSGNFRILAAEGVNSGMAEGTGESSGASLVELALALKDRGYQDALNLDGGGSANLQYFYGNLVKGADRRRLPGITYERLIPNVGIIYG